MKLRRIEDLGFGCNGSRRSLDATYAGCGTGAPVRIASQALSPQCIYADAKSYSKDAGHLRGFCEVSPPEIATTSGCRDYCIIGSLVAPVHLSQHESCNAETCR